MKVVAAASGQHGLNYFHNILNPCSYDLRIQKSSKKQKKQDKTLITLLIEFAPKNDV